MAKKKAKNTTQSTIEGDLNTIKRLLIVFLIKTGTSLSELSLALQMDPADVSRMLPIRKIKKYKEQ
jgi:hypothetical protein